MRMYRYRYVDRVPSPVQDPSRDLGTAIHEYLAGQHYSADSDVAKIGARAVRECERLGLRRAVPYPCQGSVEPIDSIRYPELDIHFEWDGVPFQAKIDALMVDPVHGLVLVDWKTSSTLPPFSTMLDYQRAIYLAALKSEGFECEHVAHFHIKSKVPVVERTAKKNEISWASPADYDTMRAAFEAEGAPIDEERLNERFGRWDRYDPIFVADSTLNRVMSHAVDLVRHHRSSTTFPPILEPKGNCPRCDYYDMCLQEQAPT